MLQSPAPRPPSTIHVGNVVARYTALYATYAAELRTLHTLLAAFCKGRGCASDDMELEISYMRLRESKPDMTWEISPHQGYSTIVLLSALKANGRGRLVSFDVKDDCTNNMKTLPIDLLDSDRWAFVRGDFRTLFADVNETKPTYVFLDSKHGREMGDFYTTVFFPWLGDRHIMVSLHDVYNPLFWSDERGYRDMNVYPEWMPNEEGMVVIDWLKDQTDMCGVYTLASKRNRAQEELFAALRAVRDAEVGAAFGLQKYVNPTLFFELNCPRLSLGFTRAK